MKQTEKTQFAYQTVPRTDISTKKPNSVLRINISTETYIGTRIYICTEKNQYRKIVSVPVPTAKNRWYRDSTHHLSTALSQIKN